MKHLIKFIVLIILSSTSVKANTVTIKCYIDEEHTYSFLLNKTDKTVVWLDQDNKNMNITILVINLKNPN